MPWFDADQHNHARGSEGQPEFAGALQANTLQAAQVCKADRYRKHDGPKHASGQILQRAGEEKQYQ